MLLSQLHEITSIDSEIAVLHQKLQSLYSQRADITSAKKASNSVSSQAFDDSISLEGIDLSL